MIVTISLGRYASAQGELVSVNGSRAKIRSGTEIIEGKLITDLATRRREASQQRRAEIDLVAVA